MCYFTRNTCLVNLYNVMEDMCEDVYVPPTKLSIEGGQMPNSIAYELYCNEIH